MLELNDIAVQALDTVFKDYRTCYVSYSSFCLLRKVWSIVRRVSYKSVPKQYIDFNELSDIDIDDYSSIHIVFAYEHDDYEHGDIDIFCEDIKHWYQRCHNLLSNEDEHTILSFFKFNRKETANIDIVHFDFESVSNHYDELKLIKEIILNEDTYCEGCMIVKSDLEIYYDTGNKYKITLTDGYFYLVDTNLYYFKKFDLFIIQLYNSSSNKILSSLVENGKVIHDDIGIKVVETSANFKRLLLLSEDYSSYELP